MSGRVRAERGAVLLLVIALVAILAAVSAALIKYAGQDRIISAQRSQEARSLTCAEAGLQFGRRRFGCAYQTSNNWNDFLIYNDAVTPKGNRTVVTGNMDGTSPGNDFEVSVQDDDDETPEGLPNDPARDNNLTLLMRSRCINPQFASLSGDQQWGETVEVRLVYIPPGGGGGSSLGGSNQTGAVMTVGDCQ
jgi:hypothetical protein